MSKNWTEEDEFKIRDDRKKYNEERIKKVLEKSEKKYTDLETNYNCTGSPSTYRTMQHYKDLIDICEMALQTVRGSCPYCESHKRTARNFAKKYRDAKAVGMTDVLNFDEVISDFEQCIWY